MNTFDMLVRRTRSAALCLTILSGCAEASSDTTGGGATSTVSSGGGGAGGNSTTEGGGGAGGSPTTEGGGGAGAGTGTTSSTTTSSTTTTTTYVDPGDTVLLLAGSPTGLVAGQYSPGGSWQMTDIEGTTTDPVTITPAWGPQTWSIGLFRSSADQLPYSILWTPSTFGAPVPIDDEPILGAPSVYTESTRIYAAVQRADGTYATSYRQGPGGGWTFLSEVKHIVNGQPVISEGPHPPYIGGLEGARAIGFAGEDGDMVYQLAANMTWEPPVALGVPGTSSRRPVFAESLLQGLIVWTQDDGQAMWKQYITFVDTPPPAQVAGVITDDPVALAYSPSTPMSRFLIAYRGLDGMLYLTHSVGSQWSPPELLFGGVQILGSPALGIGFQGSPEWAELAFISADQGDVYHARLVSGTWTDPEKIAGPGFESVAIQGHPF